MDESATRANVRNLVRKHCVMEILCFVIGVQKAGTTTLHEWLSRHPKISLPKHKETHYFSNPQKYSRGLDWYLSQFETRKNFTTRLEVDPDYIFMPGTAERISRDFPESKFLVILRSPIERAFSHYLMSVNRGVEKLGFVDSLEAESQRLSSGEYFAHAHFSYLSRSLYAKQLSNFWNRYSKNRFLYINYQNLFDQKNTDSELQRIFNFIGVDPTMYPGSPEVERRFHVGKKPRSRMVSKLVYDTRSTWSRFARTISRQLLPRDWSSAIVRKINDWNTGQFSTSVSAKIPQREIGNIPAWVQDQLTEDGKDFYQETGIDLGEGYSTLKQA